MDRSHISLSSDLNGTEIKLYIDRNVERKNELSILEDMLLCWSLIVVCHRCQLCPEMQVNEMHAPYDRHRKVSFFLKTSKTHIILSNMK